MINPFADFKIEVFQLSLTMNCFKVVAKFKNSSRKIVDSYFPYMKHK